ncbi:hypothetical protein ES332_D01G077400v1 [Gossypium tomentosum]|uniref:Receptor-like serine/threonine-protein kinase n=1 Tax=Gossypium tomentosum TaxID=34277 RepID=A0A5D2M6F7_GOSTO|nr:hypothetical protein ES332_D01G077400v1 [Gossypium tomentosum]
MEEAFLLVLFLCLLLFFTTKTLALNTITSGQSIKDGETLLSAGGNFELGFFSPGNSKSRYVGIWYKKVSTGTVVWVANRETSGKTVISINQNKKTEYNFDQTNPSEINKKQETRRPRFNKKIVSPIWFSNASRNAVEEPIAQLLDSGNFVVKDRNDNDPTKFLWQSFDYPCSTFLPGRKLGINFVTDFDRHISSWKSVEDPATGLYSFRIEPQGLPQLVLKKGPEVLFNAGSWNGVYFTRRSLPKDYTVYSYEFVLNKDDVYYKFGPRNKSIFSRYLLNPSGLVQRSVWNDGKNDSEVFSSTQSDQCYNSGHFQILVRHCINLKGCEELCLKNCSCTAYANLDIREGVRGCLPWFGDLIDIIEFSEGGQDLYIRLATSDLNHIRSKGKLKEKQKATIIASTVIIASEMTILASVLYVRKMKLRNTGEEDLELLVFDFATISTETNNFSSDNKLGQGGFGPVYRGTLIEGQEIAVKRLSKNSGQGIEEFKNKVTLIAKLQHRNLVKLFGCCIRKVERMLIYEYMPNKSLDYFIFRLSLQSPKSSFARHPSDQIRRKLLDWRIRMHIVDGIARGVLYLHHDSRLRIIHRDLKASNILLDNDMNPKISDFGLAQKFRVDQIQAKTKRVVGKYGYMSPEYALDGLFILSGRKNRGFSHPEHDHNLLGRAWRLWTEKRPLELIDKALGDSYDTTQVLRCINVALLCVQQSPSDRPNMSLVLLMLYGESILPQPKQPGFFIQKNQPMADSISIENEMYSIYESSTTSLEPR